jgi:hypothetical protein
LLHKDSPRSLTLAFRAHLTPGLLSDHSTPSLPTPHNLSLASATQDEHSPRTQHKSLYFGFMPGMLFCLFAAKADPAHFWFPPFRRRPLLTAQSVPFSWAFIYRAWSACYMLGPEGNEQMGHCSHVTCRPVRNQSGKWALAGVVGMIKGRGGEAWAHTAMGVHCF